MPYFLVHLSAFKTLLAFTRKAMTSRRLLLQLRFRMNFKETAWLISIVFEVLFTEIKAKNFHASHSKHFHPKAKISYSRPTDSQTFQSSLKKILSIFHFSSTKAYFMFSTTKLRGKRCYHFHEAFRSSRRKEVEKIFVEKVLNSFSSIGFSFDLKSRKARRKSSLIRVDSDVWHIITSYFPWHNKKSFVMFSYLKNESRLLHQNCTAIVKGKNTFR